MNKNDINKFIILFIIILNMNKSNILFCSFENSCTFVKIKTQKL